MALKLTNNATSTLSASINTSATSISVQSGHAGLFPSLSAGDWFPLTVVDSAGNMEIMRATARSGAVMTVIRAQEGTSATAFDAGARVDLRLTAAAWMFLVDRENHVGTQPMASIDGLQDAFDEKQDALQFISEPAALAGVELDPRLWNAALVSAVATARATELMASAVPPGAVVSFARNSAPSGYLKANGAAISRTTYAALFAAIGTTFGAGDGSSTFNLPDLRAEFVRGWDDARGVDAGRAFGSAQADAIMAHGHSGIAASGGGHQHDIPRWFNVDANHGHNNQGGPRVGVAAPPYTYSGNPTTSDTTPTASSGVHDHAVTIDDTGGPESRPRNVALLYCIKF